MTSSPEVREILALEDNTDPEKLTKLLIHELVRVEKLFIVIGIKRDCYYLNL